MRPMFHDPDFKIAAITPSPNPLFPKAVRGFWRQLQGVVPGWGHLRPGTNPGPLDNHPWDGGIHL